MTSQIENIKVADLEFDRENPRLAEFDISPDTSEETIIETLWLSMDVRELVLSMAASGFFAHEPLIVAVEKGVNIVIEGNRRLCALKLLNNPEVASDKGWELPEISKKQREALESVPVLFQSREDSWKYTGFKHVNGPAKWSSFAKAKYIAEVHRTYNVQLADIASQLGDGHGTVQRLYRGLMVIEQAEREKVYDTSNRTTPRIFFSHLYTCLDRKGFSEFLELKPKEEETDSPVPGNKLKELGEVCVWLFGDKAEKKKPVVVSQNPDLKRLDAVLQDREATAALRAGDSLDDAFEIGRPSDQVLEEALLAAKRNLMKAKSYLSTGYDKSEALLKVAGSIYTLADSIYEEMDRLRSSSKKKVRITDLED